MRCENSSCRQDDLAANIFGKYSDTTVCGQGTPGGDCLRKYTNTMVYRKIEKTDLDKESIPADSCTYNTGTRSFPGQRDAASDVKFTDTKVCREIEKTDLDKESVPADSCTYNTASGCNPVNQRNFNLFVLPCPGWGARGGILSKIKKFLTFYSISIEELLHPARLLYEVKNES